MLIRNYNILKWMAVSIKKYKIGNWNKEDKTWFAIWCSVYPPGEPWAPSHSERQKGVWNEGPQPVSSFPGPEEETMESGINAVVLFSCLGTWASPKYCRGQEQVHWLCFPSRHPYTRWRKKAEPVRSRARSDWKWVPRVTEVLKWRKPSVGILGMAL